MIMHFRCVVKKTIVKCLTMLFFKTITFRDPFEKDKHSNEQVKEQELEVLHAQMFCS